MSQIGINIEAQAEPDNIPQVVGHKSGEEKEAGLASEIGHKLDTDNIFTPQVSHGSSTTHPSISSVTLEKHKSAMHTHSNTLQIIEGGSKEEEHKLAMDFQRSSTLPLEFTKNLMNKLEFEHDFNTDDNKIKIQVYDLRKPEESKEIPLISSLWEEKQVPVSGIDPLAGKLKSKLADKNKVNERRSFPGPAQLKRRNTFERSYTSDEVTKPITVSVTAIAEEGEEDSDTSIQLIQDIWGPQKYIESEQDVVITKQYERRKSQILEEEKEREDDYNPEERVYYSPEGKRQINKRTSTVKYESLDDDKLEVMKIEVNDLRDDDFDSDLEEADTPLIAEIWGTKNELDDIIDRRSSEKELKNEPEEVKVEPFEEETKEKKNDTIQSEEDQDYMEGLDTVEQMDNHLIFYEPKASQPNLTRPAKQSLMSSNYFGMDITKKTSVPNFYSSLDISKDPHRAESRGAESEAGPQRPGLLADCIGAEDIRFEGELPSPPNKFNQNNKLLKIDGDYTFGNSQIDIPHDDLTAEEIKEFSPLNTPKTLLVFDKIIKLLGEEDFEMFIMVLIEYAPLLGTTRVSLNIDLSAFLRFFDDFQQHLQVPKDEAAALFKKNAQNANTISILRFVEIIKENASKNHYFHRDSLQVLLSEILSKSEKMELLRKFREYKIQKTEAQNSLSIQALLQEREAELKITFSQFSEITSTGTKIMRPHNLLRLLTKKKVIPEVLSLVESNKLYFFGQKINQTNFLKDQVDFKKFKTLVGFIAIASLKKQHKGKEAVSTMLKLILDE